MPLRTDISQCDSFLEIAESARDTCIEASSREIPLDIIAQEAPGLSKSAEDPGLAHFLLGYYRQPSSSEEIKIADGSFPIRMLEPKVHVSPQLASGAVFSMHLLPSGDLKCRMEFNSGAFDQSTIAGFAQAYRRILAVASAEPNRKWKTL